jgi:regulator of sirC expression with transglutaminase-like and TPR domain
MADAMQAIALQPESAEGYNLRGTLHHEALHYREALADYDRAIALAPTHADAWCNRGNALYDLGRLEEARAALEHALALAPEHPEATSNLGMVLQDLGRFDAAREAYDRAIALRPRNPESWKRRATLHLLRGAFEPGWADFERSTRLAPHDPLSGVPRWEGGDPRGMSLLVHEPSGIGDAIQFFRYLPMLAEAGARVAFTGSPRLFRLLATCDPRIAFVPPADLGPAGFDAQIDLWGLPRLLSPTPDAIPTPIPYLHAEPARVASWRAWLGEGRHIGIAWQGRPGRKIDAGRSIPLSAFAPLASLPGASLVCLQRNAGIEQLADLPAAMRVRDPGAGFDAGGDAFLDTAAMMMALDLVVTSDTAIAHLAGALGRPVWLALKHIPEWRWQLDRDDSPWYPRMRLFRQPAPGAWAPVFAAMRDAWRDDVD